MRRQWLLLTAAVLGTVAPTPIVAQDPLEPIWKKEKLSSQDKGTIEAEVSARVKRLTNAASNPSRRISARDRLIRVSQVEGATDAFRAAYAEVCATQLAGLAAGDQFEVAFDAILILVALDDPSTADALAGALDSEHTAIRYAAARGIQRLHRKLKDPKTCRTVLRALGRAGAKEQEELVLRMIYEAIHFQAQVPGFPYGDECARALCVVFAGRTKQLEKGSRDETYDKVGYAVAVACYPSAEPAQQAELIGHMAAFLKHAVDRYFDPDTAPEYRPTLVDLIQKAEDAVREMIQASNVAPPRDRVSDRIKSDAADKEEAVRAALARLMGDDNKPGVLNGPPWNLP